LRVAALAVTSPPRHFPASAVALSTAEFNVAYAWCRETHVVIDSGQILYVLNGITDGALNSAIRSAGRYCRVFVQKCCEELFNGIGDPAGNQDVKARMLRNGHFKGVPSIPEFYVLQIDRIAPTTFLARFRQQREIFLADVRNKMRAVR
jgi:hypothetical protein